VSNQLNEIITSEVDDIVARIKLRKRGPIVPEPDELDKHWAKVRAAEEQYNKNAQTLTSLEELDLRIRYNKAISIYGRGLSQYILMEDYLYAAKFYGIRTAIDDLDCAIEDFEAENGEEYDEDFWPTQQDYDDTED